MSLKDEQERFKQDLLDGKFDPAPEETRTRTVSDLEAAAFDAYESSPKYKKMIEVIKFYGEGKHYKLTTAPEFRRGAFYDTVTIIEEIERGDLASALLKEIGEAE